jgi:hypothetical protein
MKHLEHLVTRLNEVTNSPMEYSDKDAPKFKANIGHYHLDGAYGGWNLARTMNNGGGIDQPIGGGFHSKRELYDKIDCYLRGIYLVKEGK